MTVEWTNKRDKVECGGNEVEEWMNRDEGTVLTIRERKTEGREERNDSRMDK
jgi:hypothetical protein